jgi:MFS family permease
MSGLFFGLSFLLVNQYFDKRRGLAMGLFFSGSSIGRMTLPLLVAALVHYFSTANAIAIIASIWSVCIPAAWLHRPLADVEARHERSFWKKIVIEQADERIKGEELGNVEATTPNRHSSPIWLVENDIQQYEISRDAEQTAGSEGVVNPAFELEEPRPEYVRKVSAFSFHTIASDVTDKDPSPTCSTVLKKIIHLPRDVFRQLEFGLFKNPIAVMIIFSECCSWTAINHISYMTANFLRDRGLGSSVIGQFMAVPPALDLVARFTVPLLHDQKWIQPKTAYAFGLMLMAASAAGEQQIKKSFLLG